MIVGGVALPPHRLVGRRVRRRNRRADERLVLIPQRDLVAGLRTVQVEYVGGRRTRAASRVARDRDARRADPLHVVVADAVDGVVERVPVGPGALERFPGLNALPGDVEVEHETGQVAIRQIGEQRVAERIVFLEQDQHGEIGQITKHAGDGESRVRRTPQRGRRTVIVKALQMHRAMRLQLVDRVWHEAGHSPTH